MNKKLLSVVMSGAMLASACSAGVSAAETKGIKGSVVNAVKFVKNHKPAFIGGAVLSIAAIGGPIAWLVCHNNSQDIVLDFNDPVFDTKLSDALTLPANRVVVNVNVDESVTAQKFMGKVNNVITNINKTKGNSDKEKLCTLGEISSKDEGLDIGNLKGTVKLTKCMNENPAVFGDQELVLAEFTAAPQGGTNSRTEVKVEAEAEKKEENKVEFGKELEGKDLNKGTAFLVPVDKWDNLKSKLQEFRKTVNIDNGLDVNSAKLLYVRLDQEEKVIVSKWEDEEVEQVKTLAMDSISCPNINLNKGTAFLVPVDKWDNLKSKLQEFGKKVNIDNGLDVNSAKLLYVRLDQGENVIVSKWEDENITSVQNVASIGEKFYLKENDD